MKSYGHQLLQVRILVRNLMQRCAARKEAEIVRAGRDDCVLLVIDVQDRIIGTIAEHETVVENIRSLVKTARVLDVPVLTTEQEKLGEIVPELQGLLSDSPKFRKLSFSCCGDSAFVRKLRRVRRKTVIVCGIETHICVLQTVLDLLEGRYHVLLVKDATSSHFPIDRETAVERMRDAGAFLGTSEAVIYELTGEAGTEQFRKILEIVKERRSVFVSQL
jgi:nicotinamidase-related amidase